MIRAVAPFAWHDGLIVLELPGGHAAFTTAISGDLTPPVVAAGATAAAHSGIPAERWAQDHQVHGAAVRVVTGDPDPMSGEYDGQVTNRRDVACVVRVADCLPIVLISPQAVGALHGGWRGLAGGIVERGVAAVRELGGRDICAAIGPGAGVCCYEAGDEVHAAFADSGARARRGNHADLKAVARAQLEAVGVQTVHDVGICTICSAPEELFSHRRDHGHTGRQAGIAWLS